jgi:DNA polymerase-3 subunit epsilon
MTDKTLKTKLEESVFSVVDVETTGLSPHYNRIIEIGIVKIQNLKITDKYYSLVNPGAHIPPFITQLTGITNEEVYDAPFFEDIADNVSEFISDDVLTGHNLSFDKGFLSREFQNAEREELRNVNLCTKRLAQTLYPMLRSKSLSSLSRHLRIINENSHRALSDAETTARILIKMIKNAKKEHNFKTLEDIIQFQYLPIEQHTKMNISKKLMNDYLSLPESPGTYYFLNSKGEIIYIGKAKSLRNRVRSYFLPTAPRKAKKIVRQASRVVFETTNSELTALLQEAESIKKENPRHNFFLKEYTTKYFLRINRNEEFPTVEICKEFNLDGNDYFGMFVTRKMANKVLDIIDKTFTIRECDNDKFSKGKACFLAEIERCAAPCVTKEKEGYFEELNKVYEFLYGQNQIALNRLLNRMKNLSASLKFEKAAETKELIDVILSQTHKTSLLAEPINSANVLFEMNENVYRDYILLLSGKIFVKEKALNKKDNFEGALDDYYGSTINLNLMPDNEDLEKMKIMLSWIIKNRNKVRVFYLKDYNSKEELYYSISNYSSISKKHLSLKTTA